MSQDGDKIVSLYRNSKSMIHREDGPAIIYADGKKFWYLDGEFHRSFWNFSRNTSKFDRLEVDVWDTLWKRSTPCTSRKTRDFRIAISRAVVLVVTLLNEELIK